MRESKHFCANHLTRSSIDLSGMRYPVEPCWFDESHTHFISSIRYSRETTILVRFPQETTIATTTNKNKTKGNKGNINVGFYSDIYTPISFELRVLIGTTKLYILMPCSSDDLDVYSRSPFYEKKIPVHLLANLSIDLDDIRYVATSCWCVEARATFMLHT